jgi:hypothetical protein
MHSVEPKRRIEDAHTVTDQRGLVAMFIDDLTQALNYAAKVRGLIDGPMSVQKAKDLVDACAVRIYGTRGDRNG